MSSSNSSKRLAGMIERMEHYIECWKQFNHYLALARAKQFSQEDEACQKGPDATRDKLARAKQFSQEDEDQFLETKSVITQQLELILDEVQGCSVSREDVHALIAEVPSIRSMSELNEAGLKSLENQWHKLYIGWQSMLGQLKVAQKQLESQPRWSLFGRKK
jgi:hypothetical protein